MVVIIRSKKDKINRQSKLFAGSAIGNLGFCVSWAVCSQSSDSQWLEISHSDLAIPNLPDEFRGKRVVHISDIHYSKTVSSKYVKACINAVNQLEPDFVAITGDFVTLDHKGTYAQKAAKMLSNINSKHGTFACLGNHDYGCDGFTNRCKRNNYLPMMIENLQFGNIQILRNQALPIEIDNKTLWFAGVGDCWAQDFDGDKTFGNIGRDQSVIVLGHNPKILPCLEEYDFDAVLLGHTHGLKYQFTPQLSLPILKRNDYYAGSYIFCDKPVYVNRGLGRLGRALFNPRPEITVHTLM